MTFARHAVVVLSIAGFAACSDGNRSTATTPTSPTTPAPPAAVLTAPAPDGPVDGIQLSTLRPTLTVRNGTSTQTGTRTYEFQVSDRSDFAAATASVSVYYAVVVSRPGVPEDASGKTSFTPDADLQPSTRFYWRARMSQGTVTSDWSPTATFKSKLVGYIRPGEIYDPLIHSESVGTVSGARAITWIPGRGVRIDSGTTYIAYLLPQTLSGGEFSVEVEGLAPNGPGDKTKVIGMQEGQDDFVTNRYRIDVQYRGASGFPPNCIQWRAMFGSDNDRIEPDTNKRFASVFNLNPSTAYYWRAQWGGVAPGGSGFHLLVREGGVTGSPLYDFGLPVNATYNPSTHWAYLGAPAGRSGTESASVAGAIYRNVWIGNRPRPDSLGSALDPER